MSGHDNFELEQGTSPFRASFDPNSVLDWDQTMIDLNANPLFDGPTNTYMDFDAENDNTLPSVPGHEGPTFGGPSTNGAGYVNENANQLQFSDLPQFASPPAQNFDAQPTSNTPLVHANHANDQPIHASAPVQAFVPQPESMPSPMNYGINSYNAMGLKNNSAWTFNGVDQHNLLPAYPATTAPGQYPLPSQRQYPVLQRTLLQKGDQSVAGAGAGAGAFYTHNNFQAYAAGNHNFGPQPQDSLPNAFGGLPHPAAPSTPMKSATQPAFIVGATAQMSQDSNDDAKPVSPPADPPAKKKTKTKQRPPKKPSTSNAKKTAVKFSLDTSKLVVSSLKDAKKNVTIKQFKLEVVDDDCDDVAAHKADFVLKIAKALEVDFRPEAEEHEKLTKEGRDEFTRWQTEHENKTWALLADEDVEDPSEFAQSCATILYHKILKAHRIKLIEDPGKAVANGSVDTTTKCSERINAAITAIEQYSIVKYDFLRRDRLDALLASPRGFVLRKIENCWVNYKKKDGVGPVRIDSDEKPKAKNQGKRKREEPSDPASDDEGEDEDQVEGQSDEEFVQPTKPIKRTKRTKRH